jgi:hypothetical protein
MMPPAFSFMTPEKYKSITVQQIAKAMIATSLHTPAKSDAYHHPEIMALNRHSDRLMRNGSASGTPSTT